MNSQETHEFYSTETGKWNLHPKRPLLRLSRSGQNPDRDCNGLIHCIFVGCRTSLPEFVQSYLQILLPILPPCNAFHSVSLLIVPLLRRRRRSIKVRGLCKIQTCFKGASCRCFSDGAWMNTVGFCSFCSNLLVWPGVLVVSCCSWWQKQILLQTDRNIFGAS